MSRYTGIARSSRRGALRRRTGTNGGAAKRLVSWGVARHCNLSRVIPWGTRAAGF